MLSVSKIGYTNTLDLVGDIRDYIDRKNAVLAGSGLKLVLADDQTVATRSALGIMQNNAAIGLLMVLGVCWLFLDVRASPPWWHVLGARCFPSPAPLCC